MFWNSVGITPLHVPNGDLIPHEERRFFVNWKLLQLIIYLCDCIVFTVEGCWGFFTENLAISLRLRSIILYRFQEILFLTFNYNFISCHQNNDIVQFLN